MSIILFNKWKIFFDNFIKKRDNKAFLYMAFIIVIQYKSL